MKYPVKDPLIYLEHILEAIDRIKLYVKGFDEDDFLSNELIKDAVVRNMEVIGEATKNLPVSLKKDYPEVPWKDMAGIRDRLSHFYFGIDYKIVWDAVKDDIPKLEFMIHNIINLLKKK